MTDIRQDSQATPQFERARRGARRTAWLVAGIAVAVYVGFLLIMGLGK